MSQPKECSSPTPSRRSMVEITNDIVGVREALYDATGSALLAREKCKAEDARIIYEALCRANNVLWTVVEELQAFPSETAPNNGADKGIATDNARGERENAGDAPLVQSAQSATNAPDCPGCRMGLDLVEGLAHADANGYIVMGCERKR